jgi:AcrR family transcriptional regulator
MLTLSTILGRLNGMPSRSRDTRARRGRKRYHHGRLRQALLDASLAIIAERGPSELSLRKAASRAGVSHAAPKRHFATVRDLYCAIAEDGYRRLRTHLLERVAQRPGVTPVQALAILGVAYVEFATSHPGHFRAMFHSGVTDRPASHPLEQAAGAAFDVLVEAIERCRQAGEVRPAAPRELALGAWALVHGLAVLAVDHQLANRGFPSDDPVVLAREATQRLYLGLRP